MMPDPDRVQAVFLEAVEQEDAAARAGVLDRECAGDAELRRRVEALLRMHDGPDGPFDRPLVGADYASIPLLGLADYAGTSLPDTVHGDPKNPSSAVAPEPSDPTIGAPPVADPDGSPRVVERAAPGIPGYEIQGELGRGGMGVVYRARQVQLNRPCALKMVLGGAHARPEALARFLAEARAIARLQHPNIVQIHHIGEVDGLPFFELEYVDGGSLDKALDGTPWPARRAAGLVERLARAVAEAHRLGIVHRDLKPGNVLLMADGTPKITDFGLAKAMDVDSGLTATEAIMGSPSYMAPEQAQGRTKHLGPPADVYALGAILYELLTGRPPFRGATLLETLEQTRTLEPVPPSRLVPGTLRDVETITLKCLQKDPAKRYGSAGELADDLRRFLDGEPIVARPVGAIERAWRWCRRRPAPAALTAAVVLVAALGLAGVLWQWEEAVKARNLASKRALAEAAARRETETILVDMYATGGISAGDQGEHARAALWFANAARRAQADPDRRQSNAIRARTWGRRAFRPLHAVVADVSWPVGLAVHPGGRYLITSGVVNAGERLAEHSLWDLESERSLPFPGGHATARAAAWSPDGKALAAGLEDGDVLVAGFPGGDGLTRIPFPPRIRCLAYSPDGHYLAIAGGTSARVWDVRARRFATPDMAHPEVVISLAFHPEGRLLATGCNDHKARLFAVPAGSGSPLWPPVPHAHKVGTPWYREFVSQPLFVNDGRELVTYGGEKVGLAWRAVETGADVRTQALPDWNGMIALAVLSPDGRHLAVSKVQSPTARLIEVATGRLVGPELVSKGAVMGMALSPDGRMLATSSNVNTVQLWSVPDGKPLAQPLDLRRPVQLVAFTPRGRSLATQDSGLVRLWSLPEEGVSMAHSRLDGNSSFAALSPDGALTIPTGMTLDGDRNLGSTRAVRVASGEPAGPPLRLAGKVVDAAFSPDGLMVAVLGCLAAPWSGAPELVVWDWASGRRAWQAPLPPEPRSVSYRPDGRRLAVLCGGGELLVFDAESGRELRRWQAHNREDPQHWINNGKVRFSPDGRSLLTWGMGHDLRVWEAETGQPRYPPIGHRDKCHDVQFSPDGRLMAVASYDGSVRVRNVATGAAVVELPDHPDIVYSAQFSPDGRLLVTACRDHTVRVWDWRAGRLVCPPFEHAKEVDAATFTPDGRRVISVSYEGTARVWEWRTGKPITPTLSTGDGSLGVVVTPDGKHAVVSGFHNALTVLDLGELAPTTGDPEALCRWAELLAGQRLHEGGGTVNLSADEWLDRWRAYRGRSPDEAPSPSRGAIGPKDVAGSRGAPGAGAGTPAASGAPIGAVQPRLEDLPTRFAAVDELLGAGRVDGAVAATQNLVPLLLRAVDQQPGDPGLRHWLALSLVLTGDREGYRRACASTLERFRGSEHPMVGEAARACLLARDAVDDPSVARRLAEAAVARDPKAVWWHYVLGLAEFRDGRYERAIESLEASLRLGTGWPARSLNFPVLAMAHQRLNHPDEARRWLERAHGRASGASKQDVKPGQGLGDSAAWWDRIEFRLLLREADALIGPETPADGPTGRTR
jgi:WD40 repeat protein